MPKHRTIGKPKGIKVPTDDHAVLDRLKKVRKELGLTQKEFGEKIGMAITSYASIEQGRNGMNERFKKLIQHVFQINLHYLESGEGDRYVGKFLSSPGNSPIRDITSFYSDNSFSNRYLGGAYIRSSPDSNSRELRITPDADTLTNEFLNRSVSSFSNSSDTTLTRNSVCASCIEKEKLITHLESHIQIIEDELKKKSNIIDFFMDRERKGA